ncbi:MAG: ferritin-like domain-containing protein [Blastocatellia bacterium]
MPIAWHGPYELLKPETQDMARAIQSLMEELEAIDWYGQRMDLTHDNDLRGILEHNRDEEKEHASMLLEWIRRRDGKFDETLRTYLFNAGEILALEDAQADGSPSGNQSNLPPHMPVTVAGETTIEAPPSFTVGSLRPKRG